MRERRARHLTHLAKRRTPCKSLLPALALALFMQSAWARGQPQHRHQGRAHRTAGNRPGQGAGDHRLPDAARRLQARRGAEGRQGHRRQALREAQGRARRHATAAHPATAAKAARADARSVAMASGERSPANDAGIPEPCARSADLRFGVNPLCRRAVNGRRAGGFRGAGAAFRLSKVRRGLQ